MPKAPTCPKCGALLTIDAELCTEYHDAEIKFLSVLDEHGESQEHLKVKGSYHIWSAMCRCSKCSWYDAWGEIGVPKSEDVAVAVTEYIDARLVDRFTLKCH